MDPASTCDPRMCPSLFLRKILTKKTEKTSGCAKDSSRNRSYRTIWCGLLRRLPKSLFPDVCLFWLFVDSVAGDTRSCHFEEGALPNRCQCKITQRRLRDPTSHAGARPAGSIWPTGFFACADRPPGESAAGREPRARGSSFLSRRDRVVHG